MEHGAAGLAKLDTSKGFQPRLELNPEIAGACRQIDRLDGELERLRPSPFLLEQVLRWARVRNAWSSTSLEGNPTPLDRAAALAESDTRPKDKHEQEIRRLLQYYKGLEGTRGEGPRPLTLDEIRGLHGRLLGGILEGPAGAWKRRPNYIGGPLGEIVFRPTPPERVEAELKALLAWFGGPGQALHPAVRVGVFFHEFESIHPFTGGNGRIGRALCQRLLVGEQLPNVLLVPLDATITREAEVYYDVLRLTNDTGDFTFWARYFAQSLGRAYREAKEHANVEPLLDTVPRGVARAILQHLLLTGGANVRSAELEEALGYSRGSVVQGLATLQKHGIVEVQGGGRSTSYAVKKDYLEQAFRPRQAARVRRESRG